MWDGRLGSRLTLSAQLAKRLSTSEAAALSSECMHIVIPTDLKAGDRAALKLGMQLAAGKRAKVTFLHVVPLADELNPMHWLDAIENLHRAWSRPEPVNPAGLIERSLARAHAFLQCEVPPETRRGIDVHVECRAGEFARELARYAEESAADLVLLSGGLFWGWLHILPGRVRQVLKHTRQRVAVLCAPIYAGRGDLICNRPMHSPR
jgi:nucleotide-binding universal stress UspA family protein